MITFNDSPQEFIMHGVTLHEHTHVTVLYRHSTYNGNFLKIMCLIHLQLWNCCINCAFSNLDDTNCTCFRFKVSTGSEYLERTGLFIHV